MTFAAENLREYPQRDVCRLLNISASTLYYRRKHPAKTFCTEEEREAVREVFQRHNGSFGRRTLRRELLKKGVAISEYRISKIMKAEDLVPKYGRRKGTNLHTHRLTEEKYIQDNRFAKLTPLERRNMNIWSMDFTEQKISGKKVTSCGIVSVNGKVLTGLSVNCPNTKESAAETVRRAIAKYGAPDMIMTDRGSPFTSKAFQELLKENGILHSMSRPHTPTDNPFIETFWKAMKVEIGNVKNFSVEGYEMILKYYQHYYNHERPHSTLGYCAPLEVYPQYFVI